ncbi:PQQ-dependent sugar dehydrogenase [Anditalea andensis]|uniref:Glucose/Sorbosone dehydrogenase domain-containing protein n=1 Tax=Anditalea andensis TaxID=1048983 RepID=A0A074KUY6_9BACT|nr:PQQ-dependent sugar dehydrogenase [Anditalea andensis]KEO73791.1 hypothetical protein EL17_09785 [Anditalea andensis]
MSLHHSKFLFNFFFFSLAISPLCRAQQAEQFEKRILVDRLEDPWNIIYGPDDHLWVTESKSYKVLRINPENGKRRTVLDVSKDKNFERSKNKPWPQGGLMGMALHPQLLLGFPYIYVAYVHEYIESQGEDAPIGNQGNYFKTKLVRYTYDQQDHTLSDPQVITDTIPGSNDHNGGRMLISHIDGDYYLIYSVGDMGAGQYQNAARNNHAQDTNYYEGKILRFNLEPNEEGSWIPKDNPYGNEKKTAVWSIGVRNTQGLVAISIEGKDIIYGSDHGPFSDDEINIIARRTNYGHPLIIGYADGNYDGLAAGVTDRNELPGIWNTTYPQINNEKEMSLKLQNFKEPIHSFYPLDQTSLMDILKKESSGESADWESVAHSGIAAYSSEAIPYWQHSLLVTSLNQGCLYRLKLSKDGQKVEKVSKLFEAAVRYRDVAVSPDGLKIYLITDNSEKTSGPSEENPQNLKDKGAVIEYRYKDQ